MVTVPDGPFSVAVGRHKIVIAHLCAERIAVSFAVKIIIHPVEAHTVPIMQDITAKFGISIEHKPSSDGLALIPCRVAQCLKQSRVAIKSWWMLISSVDGWCYECYCEGSR